MMSDTLISFVVPAYNAAPYVEACIDSICSLDMKGHGKEVIVVNDGSTDNTAEVLEACREKHPSLRILSQKNMGLSMARNAAMDVAVGKYLCFVDADDELDTSCDTNALFALLKEGKGDIISIGITQEEQDGRRSPYRRYVPIYNKVYAPARTFMNGRNLFPCAYSYLYRREFIESNGLRFMEGVYHEDEEFVPRTFALASSFVAIDLQWYIRMVRNDSITTTIDPAKQRRRLRDILKILRSLDAFAAQNDEYRRCMACKQDYIVVDMLRTMLRQHHGKAFRKEVIQSLREMKRFPLRWRWNVKYIAFNLLTRIIL